MLVVFDMDGVLVNVSGSYREAVRQTVQAFFKPAQGFDQLPDPLFGLEDLAAVKQSGGLNNDWDLTFKIISLLFSKITTGSRAEKPGDPWSGYQMALAECDTAPLQRFLARVEAPLIHLLANAQGPVHPIAQRFYEGDVGSGNIIKQLFQEIYLGRELFERTYGLPARTCAASGLIYEETLFFEPAQIAGLDAKYRLGIATGRPRLEALFPLQRFGLLKYFPYLQSHDDCKAEEQRRLEQGEKAVCSKPHPFMLDAIADQAGSQVGQYVYVGDMPDDMAAAKNSCRNYLAIGFMAAAPQRAGLRSVLAEAGADFIVDDAADLIRLLDDIETNAK